MRKVSAVRAIGNCFFVGLLALATMAAAAACSSSPSAQARACSARSHLESSLDQIRSFDYTHGSPSTLAGYLDSTRKGLVGIEAAVPLQQNAGLRQLGGVGRIRQLEGEARTLATQVQNGGASQLASFENAVRQRTTEMQQIVGAVNGC
jgi:hypothetical protein